MGCGHLPNLDGVGMTTGPEPRCPPIVPFFAPFTPSRPQPVVRRLIDVDVVRVPVVVSEPDDGASRRHADAGDVDGDRPAAGRRDGWRDGRRRVLSVAVYALAGRALDRTVARTDVTCSQIHNTCTAVARIIIILLLFSRHAI